jgi:hypothetical protein
MTSSIDDDFDANGLEDLRDGIRKYMEAIVEKHHLELDLRGKDFDELVFLSREIAEELERLVLIRLLRLLDRLHRPIPEGWETW